MKSPLRYPGGKSRYIKHILPHIPKDSVVISPFIGGGHIELACMSRGQLVIANDAFPPLANFWFWMKQDPKAVIDLVWEKFGSEDYRGCFYRDRKTLLGNLFPDGAADYFFVNRCSFSGATLSGGFSENASRKRFTESSVCQLEALSLERLLAIFNQDFESFLADVRVNRFVYADPPYYQVRGLYGNSGDMGFDIKDHRRLFESLQPFEEWAVSYNDCPEIRDLYRGHKFIELPPSKSMSNGKTKCKEVLILRTKDSSR